MPELNLDEAVNEIHQACDGNPGRQSPFFLIVGAGTSSPPLPLASAIEAECRSIAQKRGRLGEPPSGNPIDTYSYWFGKAIPQPKRRQEYLQGKMKDQQISPATFRLAHLLFNRSIGSFRQ
ncbi:MAG TPA: hypothetical protein VKT33_05095 [Candidatus Angelobacter sp.]|nr:hypothetical protein [Candidatus Angelobacter sp.]